MNELIQQMPPLLNTTEMYNRLLKIPNLNTKDLCETDRLIALDEIYNFYIPSLMTAEIYSKIYLSIRRSLVKKTSIQATQQRNNNYNKIKLHSSSGIIGGADVFSILGSAGIGKTATIFHTASLATNDTIYETNSPYIRVIPSLSIQTPYDCSVKALLLEIIRQIDNILQTNYFPKNIPTVDTLIGVVCQLCLNHVGLLIIDEIQNVIFHKAGNSLIHCLTEIINSANISICLVGTTECETFFSSTDYLARRTVGLNYSAMNYDDYFKSICTYLWNYQPLKHPTAITESDIEWLYEHSGGIISNLITLIHDAQELSIITGIEKLDKNMLNKVYLGRMSSIHPHINSTRLNLSPANSTKSGVTSDASSTADNECLISTIVANSKVTNIDIISELKKYISVTEVYL